MGNVNNGKFLNDADYVAINKSIEKTIERCQKSSGRERCSLNDSSDVICEFRGKNVRTETKYDEKGFPHINPYYDCNHPKRLKN